MGWAVLALVRSRRFGQPVTDEASAPPASATLTSQTIDGVVTGDVNAAGDQGDQRALADTSTMQLSAPVTVDVANVTAASAGLRAGEGGGIAGPTIGPCGPGGDTKAPSVSVTAPANGATVSGTVVTLTPPPPTTSG